MKYTSFLLAIILAAVLAGPSNAQTLNWSGIQPHQKHVANLNVGWDYGTTLGLGYAYKLNMKMPVLLNAQFSIPAGKNLLDDFNSKLGFQARAFKAGNFMTTVMVYGIFRQYQSDFVRLRSFGSEFTGVAGYYKPRWFVAAEFGFDKAIATHLKNSEFMKLNYPSVRDGWYVPTGGNFKYGIQTGYTMKNADVYVKLGKSLDQNLKSTAIIPYYFRLGMNMRF